MRKYLLIAIGIVLALFWYVPMMLGADTSTRFNLTDKEDITERVYTGEIDLKSDVDFDREYFIETKKVVTYERSYIPLIWNKTFEKELNKELTSEKCKC